MINKFFIITLLLAASLPACDRVKKKTKETINKSGEAVGEATSEFFEGMAEGVDQTLECEVRLSEELKQKGISTGKFSIESDTLGGKQNIVALYLIFNQDFKGDITVKVSDKNGLEIGRKNLAFDEKGGDADYYDFMLSKRAFIESRSVIEVI